jgi:hypothetical protein
MTAEMRLPAITIEADADALPTATLGASREVRSKVSVGRSDVLVVNPSDAIEDPELATFLSAREQEVLLVRIGFRMSFRPAPEERFERALFSVEMYATDGLAPPFARILLPDRLATGPFTLNRSLRVGVRAGVPGLELTAEGVTSAASEKQLSYVVAAGVGESDPEWRYSQTPTTTLEGSHEMAMVAEVRRGASAQATISVHATVTSGRRRTDIEWKPSPEVARITLLPNRRP